VFILDFDAMTLTSIYSFTNGVAHGIPQFALYSSPYSTFYIQTFTDPIIAFNTKINEPALVQTLNYTIIAEVSADPSVRTLFGFNTQGAPGRNELVTIDQVTYAVTPVMSIQPFYYSVPPGACYDSGSDTLYFYAYTPTDPGGTYLAKAGISAKTFSAQRIDWLAYGTSFAMNVWIK